MKKIALLTLTSQVISAVATRAPFNPASSYALLRFSSDQMFVPSNMDGELLSGIAFRQSRPVFGSRSEGAAPNPGVLHDLQNGLEPIIGFARDQARRTGKHGEWVLSADQVRYLRLVALSLQRPGAEVCLAGVDYVIGRAQEALKQDKLTAETVYLGLMASGLVLSQPLPSIADGASTTGELYFSGLHTGTVTFMERRGNLLILKTSDGETLLEDVRALQEPAPFVQTHGWELEVCLSDTALHAHSEAFCGLLDTAQAQLQLV